MNIPKWLKGRLDSDGALRIEDAVQKAEKKTSGEIVPMIVERSSTVGHVPGFVLLLLSLVSLSLWVTISEFTSLKNMSILAVISMLLILIISWFISSKHFVQRLCTARADQIHQVNIRAEVEFFEAKLAKTSERTGILLFASLMERRAVVLADKSIAEKLPPEIWQDVIELMIQGIKKGDIATGYIDAISRCGEILESHFPIKEDDRNELFDHLVIKD